MNLALPARKIRSPLSTCKHLHRVSILNVAYLSIRLSILSSRNFGSSAPVNQEPAVAYEERPRRYDYTRTQISRANRFDPRQMGPPKNQNRRKMLRPVTSTYERPVERVIDSVVDEEGNLVKLQDDAAGLPDYDPERVQVNENEVEVKKDESSEYTPTTWVSYTGKIDDGFLLAMKNIFLYRHSTEVQDAMLTKMPIQKDLLVRSKTGTGKTIAFLIPAIQRHIDYMKANNLNPRNYPKNHCGVLIISPVRELALQIALEARRLIFEIEPRGMKCQVLVGGEGKREQIRRLDRERNDIVVATPGRLLDFLRSEPGVKELLMHNRTLILDETDSLLEMGFRKEMELLADELKPTSAQRLTMMFSATVSPEVKAVAKRYVKGDVDFVNTVKATDLDVHQLVNQTYIVYDMGDHLKIILSLIISEQMKNPAGKVIVFFNTTKQVVLYTLMFRYLRKLYFNSHFQQFEIHSKKTQDARSKVTQAFRSANVGSVLFTSDVSCVPPYNITNNQRPWC